MDLKKANDCLDQAYLKMLEAATAVHLMSGGTAHQCGMALAALYLAQDLLSADIEKAKAVLDVSVPTAP